MQHFLKDALRDSIRVYSARAMVQSADGMSKIVNSFYVKNLLYFRRFNRSVIFRSDFGRRVTKTPTATVLKNFAPEISCLRFRAVP